MALKVDCYRTGKYTVCRRVCASFSTEMLQAGAVNGVKFAPKRSHVSAALITLCAAYPNEGDRRICPHADHVSDSVSFLSLFPSADSSWHSSVKCVSGKACV